MTNEELMVRLAKGDESALETLCMNNKGLIKSRAQRMAEAYHCIRINDRGQVDQVHKRNALRAGERWDNGVSGMCSER